MKAPIATTSATSTTTTATVAASKGTSIRQTHIHTNSAVALITSLAIVQLVPSAFDLSTTIRSTLCQSDSPDSPRSVLPGLLHSSHRTFQMPVRVQVRAMLLKFKRCADLQLRLNRTIIKLLKSILCGLSSTFSHLNKHTCLPVI